MADSNPLLVIVHPVLAGIGDDEIHRALPKSKTRPSTALDYVEITPLHTTIAEQYDLDWEAQQAAQERLYVEKVRPYLAGRERLAYFGLAPIPLAIHLGYRVQSTVKIDVYQRHHERENWVWTSNAAGVGRSFLEPMAPLPAGSLEAGPVVVRVSTSARIAPEDTTQMVPNALAAVDIALVSPDPDALETRDAFDTVVDTFVQMLTRLRKRFPNLTEVHLFAAVPAGLAFRLGSRINTTMFPEVVTYQYDHHRSPRYRRAIVLGARVANAVRSPSASPPPAEAKLGLAEIPQWSGNELVIGDQETFLDVWFLHAGLRVAKSVVYLEVRNRQGKTYCGTGFVIAPNLILTNHHVLYDHHDEDRLVKDVKIDFHFEVDQSGRHQKRDTYDGDMETVDGEKTHDWAIVRTKEPFREEYAALDLLDPEPVDVHDPVFIIQHPAGRPKKIGLTHNNVVRVTPDRIQYLTDTLPGSSGSPVCNKRWQVVALHYFGRVEREGEAERLRNEGIQISRVVEGLRTRGVLPAAKPRADVEIR